MKKIFLIVSSFLVLFFPLMVDAASVDFNGYYCDSKQDLGDGTFYMTCHIIVTSSSNINTIKGTLLLKNVVLESIKTSNGWTSNNGLSTSVSFTSSEGQSGTFTVADLVFTGDLSDEECEASFMPDSADYEEPDVYICKIVDGVYYGEKGDKITEEEYYEQCCNYICTVVDNKYYFDSKGNSVTYDEMVNDCKEIAVEEPSEPIENPKTGVNYGYILIALGISTIIAIRIVIKKNTKIYKI